jgi:hypothetical protein
LRDTYLTGNPHGWLIFGLFRTDYTDARIAEFEREGELTKQERDQARKVIQKKAGS